MQHARPSLFLALVVVACNGEDPETNTITKTITNTTPVNHTNTITNTNTNTNTITNTITVDTDPVLEPGHWQAPLIQLTQVLDDNGVLGENGALQSHMHVDEVRYRESDAKLFYCSYTWGIIDASEPIDATYLAQGYDWKLPSPVFRDTGCLHLDWSDEDPDISFADHRGNYDFHPHLTAIDLQTVIEDGDLDGIGAADADGDTSDDEEVITPLFGPALFEDGVSYEGMDWANGYLFVALHAGGIGVYDYDPVTLEMFRVATYEGVVQNAYDIHVVGNYAYVVDEWQGLYVLDVTDIQNITKVGELYIGGITRDVRYDNGYVYIAAGTPGFAIVDVSNPALPVLESLTPAYSTVTRIGVHNNRVATAGWIDTRVYDVTDPAAPAIIGGVRIETPKSYAGDEADERPDITARILGVDIYDDFLFIGDWWTPFTYQIFDDRTAPYLVAAEDIYYMSTGSVDPGLTGTYDLNIRNDGNEELHVYDTWVTNSAFVVTPRQANIPAGGEQDFTITFTAPPDVDSLGNPIEQSGIVNILSDDPNQGLRQGYVTGNPAGIGVGDPYPYTLGTDVFTDVEWNSTDAFAGGKVGLVAYFATF